MKPACPPAGRRASAARPTPRKPMVLGHNERVPKRSKWPLAAGLIAGVALDALLGDPRRGHPVAAFGRAAAALEARDYADSRGRGAAHAAACVLAVAAPAVALHRRTRGRPPWQVITVATAVWAVTGARSLHFEAERAASSLRRRDLAAARAVLPSLCGRDPDTLDGAGIARAVVESIAENTSDAVVAPLLWGAVAGVPGLLGYRAVNTLDAMVGHRSARYRRFGWAAARLDDLANLVPARVTALLAALCAPVVGGSASAAWRPRTFGALAGSPSRAARSARRRDRPSGVNAPPGCTSRQVK